MEDKLELYNGKTIKSIEHEVYYAGNKTPYRDRHDGKFEVIKIIFTDGEEIILKSWDIEEYSSGIYII